MIQTRLSSLTLDWSPDWTAIFGAERPIILEIGFGRGVFLAQLAKTHPDHHVIGVDISNRCLDTTERLITREKLDNARVVYSTAETALAHLFEPESLSQVHVNFPDPWFKTRQAHRRLMRREVMDWIVSRMRPGATFHLATDIQEYAEMSAELLAETPHFDNLLSDAWVREMPGRVTTKYEATAIREGRTPYYFVRRRNTLPALDLPVKKELPMSHVVFYSPLSLEAMNAAFADHLQGQHHAGNVYLHLMEAFLGKNALLIETAISEPTIDQRLALMVIPRWHSNEPGGYTVQVSALGHPRITEGVHEAVRVLADRVIALHPEARILHHKLKD